MMGVDRDASQDEIKRAYRKLARKYHPDVSSEPDAEDQFQQLQEAYEVLKDPEKRAAYDQLGANWREGQDFRPPPGWDSGFEFSGGGFTQGDAGAFSDFFESLFGRESAYGHAHGGFGGFHGRGQDHFARIALDLEDAYRGGVHAITLQSPTVDGRGRVHNQPRNLKVRIPAGAADGQQVRVPGKGGEGMGQGGAGDLFLEVSLRPHPLFRPEGRDIHLDVPVAPWEAALGARINVPTLGGEVQATIPAGARSGQRLRLKGRGLPGSPAGDQYLHLQVVVPPAKTDAERELFRKMQEQMDFDPRAELWRRTA
ncbi:MAG: DnaJ C-terminal domain-containing protein [Halofilum sp. (in: g-proteobacteria)]|nr:DnaJ C-terminal domain-containing protein [Halofilum sp. (in: g-proteobacteria)]